MKTFPQHELPAEIIQQILSQSWTVQEKSTAIAMVTLFGKSFDPCFLDCAEDDDKQEILLRAKIIEDTIMDKLCRNALAEINGSLN